jgi:ATP-dependent helicase/nuclease subunit A
MTHPRSRAHQITAADPGLSVFVTANAGSGKTTTLVDRVARLLLRRVEPGEILCVTYTKAAAAEMQARLFDKLGVGPSLTTASWRRSLAQLDGRDPAALTGGDLSDARRLFARALETPGGLKIQTIHAFCEKLLRGSRSRPGSRRSFTRAGERGGDRPVAFGARGSGPRRPGRSPDGPVGQAPTAHFAVELDWGSFQSAGHDRGRARQADRLCRAGRGGDARDRTGLTGADPDRTPTIWRPTSSTGSTDRNGSESADAMATGSTNDQKIAAAMRRGLSGQLVGRGHGADLPDRRGIRAKSWAPSPRRRAAVGLADDPAAEISVGARRPARGTGGGRHHQGPDFGPGPRRPLRGGQGRRGRARLLRSGREARSNC